MANLPILGVKPLGIGNQNISVCIPHTAGDLPHRFMVIPGGEIGGFQDIHLSGIGHGRGNDLHRMQVEDRLLPQDDLNAGAALTQCLGGLLGAAQQASLGFIHSGGHDAAQALVHPHRRTGDHSIVDIVHPIVHHVDGVLQGMLGEQLGIVRPGGYCLLQHPTANFFGYHKVFPFAEI